MRNLVTMTLTPRTVPALAAAAACGLALASPAHATTSGATVTITAYDFTANAASTLTVYRSTSTGLVKQTTRPARSALSVQAERFTAPEGWEGERPQVYKRTAPGATCADGSTPTEFLRVRVTTTGGGLSAARYWAPKCRVVNRPLSMDRPVYPENVARIATVYAPVGLPGGTVLYRRTSTGTYKAASTLPGLTTMTALANDYVPSRVCPQQPAVVGTRPAPRLLGDAASLPTFQGQTQTLAQVRSANGVTYYVNYPSVANYANVTC